MSNDNEDTSLALDDEAYVGPSDEYKNHVDVRDQPFRSEHPTVAAFEQRGIDWTRDMVVKRVDASAALATGIVTDIEGNVIETGQPVDIHFRPVDSDGDPTETEHKGLPGQPDFAEFVAKRAATKTGDTSTGRAGGSTEEVDLNSGDDYSQFTVVELQDELRGRDLPTSGIKDELIERLRADDND